ncbi:MAG: hypothetical protein HZA11_07525 [Nitrospirae bacterium]|nr:hypothetical protein [Nitrospirota bacterium]
MKNISVPKKLLLSFLSVACILAVSGVAYSGNIIIKPGKFDHFAVQIPEKSRAGEGVMVRLQAYDVHDNLITDFGEAGKDFKVSVSGSAQAQPSTLKSASFTGGTAGINITDKKAESVTLSISEFGSTVPVVTREIVISPNKLDHFLVQSPQSAVAGNNFDVKVIARDAFDNPVADTEIDGRNIKITSSGGTNFKVINTPAVFKNGASIATLMGEKVGEAAVEVHDTVTGSKGASPGIKVMPAILSHFKVYAPKETVAGQQFEVTIGAFDAFDNTIDNYASYGSGVNISSTGQAKLLPSFAGPSEFRNGQAIVNLRYEKAEEISIVATENNKSQQGKSPSMKVNPSAPDNFTVATPDTAVAGQRFKIKIEAYDKFNNIVRNYNLAGNDVYLNVTGTGVLSPKVVPASEFVGGIATLDVVYDRAESFAISASMATKREEKITVKEQKAEPVAPAAKAAEKPSVPKAVERSTAEKHEEKPVRKAAEKPVKPEKQAPAKEEKAVAKKAEIKEAVKEPVKEKKAKEKFFEIKKVSIIEAKNKAMVIINMKSPNGPLDYKGEIDSQKGKDWIKVSLKPAVNKAKKLWKFKSAFVKEVLIEDDAKADGLIIRVETLSKQVTFDVNKVKDSLVISITNP